MLLDSRTLVVVLVCIGGMLGTAAFLTWRAHRHITALAYWAAAGWAAAVGLAFIALSGVWPSFIVVPVSNAAVLTAYMLIWFGVHKFDGRPIPFRAGLIAVAAVTACNMWFLFVTDDIAARILIVSAGIAGFSTLSAVELARPRRSEPPRQAKRMTALVFALHAAFVTGRALMIPDPGSLDSVLGPDVLQSIVFLEAILAVTAWSFGFLAMTSERLQADLDRLATYDPLTQTLNRRAFLEQADRELARAERARTPLALLLLDLDRFKRVNDEYGHMAGDALLRAFAETVTARLRQSDLFGRYGGEEFCLLLPDTDPVGAKVLAEALRGDFERRSVEFEGNRLSGSVSIGVAECRTGAGLNVAFADADAALYTAKRNGRNQVVLAEPADA